ncbi:MAG: pilus assembly protein PilM [Candidatus Omnitrophota bacterium]
MAKHKSSSIGLDIGSRYIKLVELKRAGKGVMLTKFGIKEIPDDPGLDRNKAISQLISQLFSENKIKPSSVNVCASGQSVFIRFVKLLSVKEDKLRQTMKFEAQNQIPFPLNEVNWDWAVLDKDKGAAQKAVIIAIKKNIIEDTISALKSAKLSTSLIDVSTLSVYNCMAFNEDYDDSKLGAIVDMGSKSTNFIVYNKGNVWIRSFPIAADRMRESRGQGAEEIISEIERSLEYYFMQQGEDPSGKKKLDDLIITGGGSLFEDMEAVFAERLGVKPRLLDPFRKLRIAKEMFQAAQAKGIKNQFGVAVGLALRDMEPLKIEVNFLKETISERSRAAQKRVYTGLSAAALALLLASVSIFMRQDYFLKKAKLEKIDEMMEVYRTYEPKIKEIQESEEALKEKIGAIYQVAFSRAMWLDVFGIISGIIPDDVWLTDFSGVVSMEKSGLGRLDLNGKAFSYQAVNNFVTALKASPTFRDVKPISSSVEKDKDTAEEVVKFSITMDINASGE